MSAPLFDLGLQPERTALAWRRTALALVAGSLVGARVLAPALGALAGVLGACGVVAGLSLGLAAARRARAVDAALRADASLRTGPGAGVLAAVAAGCLLLGVAALVAVLTGSL